MPRLAPVHWRKLERVFLLAGFTFHSQRGSHRAYTKKGCKRPVVIPTHDLVGVDVIKSNLATARISREEYFRLLAE